MTDISTIWAVIISSHLKEDLFAIEFKVWSTTTDSLVFFTILLVFKIDLCSTTCLAVAFHLQS